MEFAPIQLLIAATAIFPIAFTLNRWPKVQHTVLLVATGMTLAFIVLELPREPKGFRESEDYYYQEEEPVLMGPPTFVQWKSALEYRIFEESESCNPEERANTVLLRKILRDQTRQHETP